MTIVYNPSNLQFGRVEPYLSVAEFKASPTASMLNYETLVEGGTQSDQDDALYQLILRAGSKADVYTMGKLGTLNATTNTENARSTPNRWGEFQVHPDYTPVLGVSAFQWGTTPGMGNVVSLSTNNCFIDTNYGFTVSQTGAGQSISYAGINALSAIVTNRYNAWGPLYIQYTYINGWPNTYSSGVTNAGSTTMIVTDPTGIQPGMQMTIWDGSFDEVVTISPTYTPGTATLTFASGTQYAHATGTNITTLPAIVKQAVIHFVIAMVAERGDVGFVINSVGEAEPVSHGQSHEGHEMAGYDCLDTFQRTWGKT